MSDDYYDPYKNSSRAFKYSDLIDELPSYDREKDLSKDVSFSDYIDYYRYMINTVLIAGPWVLFGLAAVFWNLYFNAEWNRMWADGNIWLVGNTVFIISQFLVSLPLVFELPVFLRAMRLTRLYSFFGAILYTVVYVISAFEWYEML